MSYPPQGEEERPRNPETKARHRREVWWQVFLPLLLGVILVGALVLGIILSGIGDTSVWADVSLIWVIIPLLIMALIPLVIFIAVIVGITWLIVNAPPFAFQAQTAFKTVEAGVRRVADQAAEPILRVQSGLASLQAVRRAPKTKEPQDS